LAIAGSIARPTAAQIRPNQPTGRRSLPTLSLSPTSPVEAFAPCAKAGAFRFGATVIKRDSITTRLIASSRLTAVVRVDTVLPGAPRAVRPLDGRIITVILSDTSDTSAVQPGDRALYVASGVLFGSGVVLRAHCRIGLGGGTTRVTGGSPQLIAFAPLLAKADSLNDRTDLLARTQVATVVAAVRVISIDSSLNFSYPGEHNPRWRTATAYVLGRAKPANGSPNVGDTLRFYFPGAEDFMYEGIHVRPNEEAMVLLHRVIELSSMLRMGLDSTSGLVLSSRLDRRVAGDSSLVKVP
jgi:hypothetical protein